MPRALLMLPGLDALSPDGLRSVAEDWGPSLGGFAASVLVLAVAHALAFALALRRAPREGTPKPVHLLWRRVRWGSLLVLVFGAAIAWLSAAPLSEERAETAQSWLRAGLIASLTWTVIRAVSVIDELVMGRYDVSVADNLRARQMHTRAQVFTRAAEMVIGLAGVAAVLMSFEPVRQVGAGLLASAGVAGLAVGFAARPVLGNLIAGLQIAITQPIRIDDAVVIDGEWGWIEEITSTYVVVRIWDERRLIVPLSRVIEQPFENWTRRTSRIIGTVELHLDYTVAVDALRDELTRLLEAHEKWDGRVNVLQVIDSPADGMVLRALVSAATSPAAWDLRCDIREGLIAFVQREHPEALPRLRAEVGRPHAESGPDGAGGVARERTDATDGRDGGEHARRWSDSPGEGAGQGAGQDAGQDAGASPS